VFSLASLQVLSLPLLQIPVFVLTLGVLSHLMCDHAASQPVIKAGLVVSAMKYSRIDTRGESGDDFRPFLGYEVDWVQNAHSYPDVGFQAGLSYSLDLSAALRLQPELFFSRRGYHFYHTELYNTSYGIIVYYLEAPVLLSWRLPVDWSVHPRLVAGPYAAWKLRGVRVVNIWGEEETRNLPSVNSFDYGIVFAAAVEFPVWSEWLSAELRFNWGLSNIMTPPADYVDLHDDPGSVRNLAIAFIVGYQL
ncbi:MAG: PorT family protein, partial [Ignavibacteria bacterium]|nr:PorT family protein [Ignavibacteria bacterium]